MKKAKKKVAFTMKSLDAVDADGKEVDEEMAKVERDGEEAQKGYEETITSIKGKHMERQKQRKLQLQLQQVRRRPKKRKLER